MVTYIALINFTEQGVRNVKDTVKQGRAFKEAAAMLGVAVKDIYWTVGQYDIIAKLEGPGDAYITGLPSALSLRRRGWSRAS